MLRYLDECSPTVRSTKGSARIKKKHFDASKFIIFNLISKLVHHIKSCAIDTFPSWSTVMSYVYANMKHQDFHNILIGSN